MKPSKIIIGSLLIALFLLVISGFIAGKDHKAFTYKCYRYTPTFFRNLDVAYPDFVSGTLFPNPTNWVVYVDDPNQICRGGTYICRVCFDDSQLNATVTLNGIFLALYNYANTIGVPPHASSMIINVSGVPVSVTVYLQNTA